ncbi:MAG: hypothetical protein L3J69_02135 [Desulfobacula sp.]|nr:hypothetical protein [Desulfobacula sp.]
MIPNGTTAANNDYMVALTRKEVMMPVIASSISEQGAKNLGIFQAAFGAGSIVMAIFI